MKVETRKRREGGQLTHKGKNTEQFCLKMNGSSSVWIIVKHLIMSLWLRLSSKHSLCLTLTSTFSHIFGLALNPNIFSV